MKYFFLLFLLTIFSCSPKPKDCQRFKTGTFRYTDSTLKNLIVERNDSMQIETDEKENTKVICEVEWLSDCTYLVTPVEIINFPEDTKLVPMEIEIIETTNNSYTFVSILDTLGYKYEMKKIK